jgi:hypothetical protein
MYPCDRPKLHGRHGLTTTLTDYVVSNYVVIRSVWACIVLVQTSYPQLAEKSPPRARLSA